VKTENHQFNEDEAVWRVPVAAAFFGVSVATFYRGVADGRYPKPFRAGLRAARVSAAECRACRDAMMAGRAA
jgi:predicted DNA-binding transcriptional regulator AlpA